ncbi:MAG: hypothetical protein ACYCQK_05900 [Acidiferrobacteraceae bacterium]
MTRNAALLVSIRVIENVFTLEPKRTMIKKGTDAMLSQGSSGGHVMSRVDPMIPTRTAVKRQRGSFKTDHPRRTRS